MKGIELFNRGLFFEAHEIWEELWGESVGREKKLYEALIKMAVALLKWQSGIPGGARKMYDAALKAFAELPDRFLEIDIRRLEGAFRLFFSDFKILPKIPESF